MASLEYRYDHFDASKLIRDVSFHGGPGARAQFPDFDLPTAFGGRVDRSDLEGRPFVLITGSYT